MMAFHTILVSLRGTATIEDTFHFLIVFHTGGGHNATGAHHWFPVQSRMHNLCGGFYDFSDRLDLPENFWYFLMMTAKSKNGSVEFFMHLPTPVMLMFLVRVPGKMSMFPHRPSKSHQFFVRFRYIYSMWKTRTWNYVVKISSLPLPWVPNGSIPHFRCWNSGWGRLSRPGFQMWTVNLSC